MSRRPSIPELPGSDASWFLELVGAIAPTPTPKGSLADLAAESNGAPDDETEPQVAAVAAAGSLPDATAVVGDDPFPGDTSTTGASIAVEGLDAPATGTLPVTAPLTTPDAASPAPPAPPQRSPLPEGWTPNELAPELQTRRSVRLGSILATLVLVVVVGAAVVLVPRFVRSEAASTAMRYETALVDLRNVLPDAQLALATLTDPTAAPDDVTATVPTVATLDAAAHDVVVLGDAPLPSTPPLVPRGPLDALEPTRRQLSLLGNEGSTIASRLGHVFSYRTTVGDILDTGPLPVTAEPQQINALSVDLAETLANDAELVAALPDDAAFSELRDAVDAALERFATWQGEYVEALGSGDEAAATVLVDELSELRRSLVHLLDLALADVRPELDAQIIELAGQIEATIDDLG